MFLNVGGTVFETRRETLQNKSSFFAGFETSAETETIFIDRDPTHFRHILNYLRGVLTFPPTRLGIAELRHEAEFYALDGMVTSLNNAMHKCEHDLTFQLGMIGNKMA